MTSRQWSYLINTFLVATKGSFRLMKQIGDYTLAALAARMPQNTGNAPAAEDIFTQLYTALLPLVQAFDDAYIAWLNQQGVLKGQTKSLTDLLDDLSSTIIQAWERDVEKVYLPGTERFIQLFPRHRIPFQQGSQQDRITAVGTLRLAIGNDADLQTLRQQVDAYHDLLVVANGAQKGSKSNKKGSSTEVEADRNALGIGLYGALGLLMNYYKETPQSIADIIPVDAPRSHEQTLFKQAIDGGETKLVFTRTLADDDHLKISVPGNTALQIALVPGKNDPMPENALTVQSKDEKLVTPDALGAKGNRFLIVKNLSATEEGAFIIELV